MAFERFKSSRSLHLGKREVGGKGTKVKLIDGSSRMVIIDQNLEDDVKRTYIYCKTGAWDKLNKPPKSFLGKSCRSMSCYLESGIMKKGSGSMKEENIECTIPSPHNVLSITGFNPGWSISLENMSEFDSRKLMIDLIVNK